MLELSSCSIRAEAQRIRNGFELLDGCLAGCPQYFCLTLTLRNDILRDNFQIGQPLLPTVLVLQLHLGSCMRQILRLLNSLLIDAEVARLILAEYKANSFWYKCLIFIVFI